MEPDEIELSMPTRISKIETDIALIRDDLKDLLNAFHASKGFLAVVVVIGRVVGWLAFIIGSISVIRKWLFP